LAARALEELGIVIGPDGMPQEVIDLWNDAWNLARERYLTEARHEAS
jgi:hypothetical protein